MSKKIGNKVLNTCKAFLLPLGVYLLFAVITGGRFGTPTSIMSILRTSVVPLILGMGMSFCMSMGMWDFSAGAVVYAAAIFSANLANYWGLDIPGICLFSVLISVALTACTGLLYNRLRIPCLVLSLGLVMVIEALPNLLVRDYTGRISILQSYLAESPWCFLIALVMFAIFFYINNSTTLGADIHAIGANISIANNAGVNIDRVKFIAFLLSGLFLGVTSIIYLSANVSVTAVTGFTSVGMIYDSMMGIFVASVLAKYINYSFAVVIGIFTIRMLGTGLVACGMSSQMRGIMTGVFLFVVLAYSANQGVFEKAKAKKRIAREANIEYEASMNT